MSWAPLLDGPAIEDYTNENIGGIVMSNGADIQARFRTFLESSPDDYEVFEGLRQSIIRSDLYRPYSHDLNTIERLIEEELYGLARTQIDESMPNLLLSPRAHEMLARVAAAQDDGELVEEASNAALMCLEAIAASGDGSRERPFRVLRTSDEYDLLDYLHAAMEKQQVVHVRQRHYDVLTCEDGRELWFDITQAYKLLGDSIEE